MVRTNQWFIVSSVLLSLILSQAYILLLPLSVGLSGLLLQFNPVMRLAKLFLKKNPSAYIPEDYDQQQFNQVIAVVCLAIALFSFYMGWIVLFYIFSIIVALAAFVAILGFCIGCYVRFKLVRYLHNKSKLKQN
nr:DUF4395 domain-containing protein [Bacillus mesophilus]